MNALHPETTAALDAVREHIAREHPAMLPGLAVFTEAATSHGMERFAAAAVLGYLRAAYEAGVADGQAGRQ